MNATATKGRTKRNDVASTMPERVRKKPTKPDTAKLKQQLAIYERRFEEIDVFLDFVREQKVELAKRQEELVEAKAAHDRAKAEVRDVEGGISSAKDSLFKILEPGACKALPLFDRMEPADIEKHGENANVWRQEPVSALRLSASTNALLIGADIVLVGQLQDMVLSAPGRWQEQVPGMTDPIAAAVADKLNEFIFEACRGAQ